MTYNEEVAYEISESHRLTTPQIARLIVEALVDKDKEIERQVQSHEDTKRELFESLCKINRLQE